MHRRRTATRTGPMQAKPSRRLPSATCTRRVWRTRAPNRFRSSSRPLCSWPLAACLWPAVGRLKKTTEATGGRPPVLGTESGAQPAAASNLLPADRKRMLSEALAPIACVDRPAPLMRRGSNYILPTSRGASVWPRLCFLARGARARVWRRKALLRGRACAAGQSPLGWRLLTLPADRFLLVRSARFYGRCDKFRLVSSVLRRCRGGSAVSLGVD